MTSLRTNINFSSMHIYANFDLIKQMSDNISINLESFDVSLDNLKLYIDTINKEYWKDDASDKFLTQFEYWRANILAWEDAIDRINEFVQHYVKDQPVFELDELEAVNKIAKNIK